MSADRLTAEEMERLRHAFTKALLAEERLKSARLECKLLQLQIARIYGLTDDDEVDVDTGAFTRKEAK